MFSMSTVLITGVNGFIGSHVARRFLNSGHRVRGLARSTSDLRYLNGLDIDLFTGDITDKPSLLQACAGAEIVVHVAGFASDWGSIQTFRKINLQGVQNIAEAGAENGVKRLTHISSAAIHGFPNQRCMNEESPMPATKFPYCESKKAAEIWLNAFRQLTALEIVIIRPGNVYGPNDHTFISKYLDALVSGKIAYIDGGRHWTCPVYIENLADAVEKACFVAEAAGQSFIITDGLDIDWKNFTNAFADALQIKRPTTSVPFALSYAAAWLMEMIWKSLRAKNPPPLTRYRICNGGRDYHFSIAKARRVLGFQPQVPFEEAERRTVEWYKRLNNTNP
jgi:nucleoside-diphosphate-sugar epimerase